MNIVNIEAEQNKKEIEKGAPNTYTRKEIVEIFQILKKENKIIMNKSLEKPHEDVFHLVEKEGDIRLEFLDPKAIKVPVKSFFFLFFF